MKMTLLTSLLTLSAFATSAQAAVYVSCGTGEMSEELIFANQEAQFSSVDDDFEGAVGGTWELKLGNNEEWHAKSKKITAKTSEKDDATIVEVIIKTGGKSPSGPMGIRYVLTDIYSDEPSLEKYNLSGGFAGSVKLGEYKCVSAND